MENLASENATCCCSECRPEVVQDHFGKREQIIFQVPFWKLDGLCGDDVSYLELPDVRNFRRFLKQQEISLVL